MPSIIHTSLICNPFESDTFSERNIVVGSDQEKVFDEDATLSKENPLLGSKASVEKQQQKSFEDIKTDLDHRDAMSCKVLVEEVFQPQPAVRRSPVVEEASFLPRLLSRASNLLGPKVEPPENLGREIQALRAKQNAAAHLLNAIEHEAETIEQRLQEKEGEKRRQDAEKQSKGFFGSPLATCLSCASTTDDEDVNIQKNWSADLKQPILLRPALHKQLQESKHELIERDGEIHKLKFEVDRLRKGHVVKHEAVRQREIGAVLEPAHNKEEAILRQYAVRMSLAKDFQLQSLFFAWKKYAHQRTMRCKMVKRASLAFAAAESQRISFVFFTWNALVIHKKQAQVLAQNTRRKAMGEIYAAKLIKQSVSSTLQATFAGWWRCCKESALEARLAVQAEPQTQKSHGTLSALGPKHPACCTLM